MTYRLTFAVGGRARFLSHLETVDTLLGALRRAGYQIALSKGMKPRPVISLAMPRAVGVQALADLADVELVGDPEPADVAERLDQQLPRGMHIVSIEPAEGRSAASRVEATVYEVEVEDDVDWLQAIAAFAATDSLEVVRTAPGKADRRIDVTQYCSSIEHEPGLLRMELRMTDSGTARPEEIAQAVAGLTGRTANIKRLVRTRICLRDQPVGVRT
ncbi:MAG TPA: TIGR03936 family radical SAM-associated protein [Gaiellales bacterium]